MIEWTYNGDHGVAALASRLYADRRTTTPLSPFVFMTDPQRVPDPLATAKKLPEGAAIIYRHFGRQGHRREAENLRQITFERKQQFLIGHDPVLAKQVGADGVHFRRDEAVQAPMRWRKKCPDWIMTMAGLKGDQTYGGDLSILDGLFVSSVFYSKSPSAGDPIGIDRFSKICRTLTVPVFALGGINQRTANQLINSGAAGLAGIDGLLP